MIDLHAHSTCSDGTDSPAGVVETAAAAGLSAIALTDHDTAAGWAQATARGVQVGVEVIPGIEISCRRDGASFHLLGYLVDATHPGLAVELERSRTSRQTRAQAMVERLALDYPISWADVLEQTGTGATIGRPHLADALVAAGSFGNRDEAFAAVLYPGSPYHVRHYAPDLAAAVRVVRDAGGLPVLAHCLARRQRRQADDALIEELADAGLAGLEIAHRDHDDADRARLSVIAGRLGLIATGGSDYHGTGKQNRIGENLTTADQWQGLQEA